jgi:hypothetical protein
MTTSFSHLVVPPRVDVEVPRTVRFEHQPCPVGQPNLGVEVAPASGRVSADHLPIGLGESGLTAEPEQVDFAESLGPAGDVDEGRPQEAMEANRAGLLKLVLESLRGRHALLNRSASSPHPRRGVVAQDAWSTAARSNRTRTGLDAGWMSRSGTYRRDSCTRNQANFRVRVPRRTSR